MNRRTFFTTTAAAGLAASAQAQAPHSLPSLPYAVDALEPSIDAQTMTIHHTKHHQAYVDNLNKAVGGSTLAAMNVENLIKDLSKIPDNIRTAVRNHGGGHANHSLFWQCLAPKGGAPSGKLAAAIAKDFGSREQLEKLMSAAAMGVFGSGWAWLSLNKAGKLVVESTPNQDSPLMSGSTPVFGIDVWEHAYYLKYQNRRADYVAAIWKVINWEFISDRYAKLGA
jgi:Fe-Mn family superoxide dismutase